MTMAVSGSRSEIAPAAAIPPPGMLMSRRQTAGRSARANSTAASALAASPHTSKPSSSRTARIPARVGGELEAPAERLGALAHAHEAEAAEPRVPGVETGAVVGDAKQGAVPVRELHADVLCPAVPARVRDRLADDADERLALVG